jgi:SAM-dependent methyltransferase
MAPAACAAARSRSGCARRAASAFCNWKPPKSPACRHVLQVGDWGLESELLASAETLHRAVLGTFGGAGAAAVIDPERLPLGEKTVDAVLLPHTLEFTRSPHNVLREANRVLNDRGRLFVLGFNPWGATALRGGLGLRPRSFPGGARFYSAGRLHDWLELLDFEVTEVRRFGTGFPWLAPRSLGERWSPGSLLAPFADVYLLTAKKRVLPVNLIGRLQRAQVKPLVGLPAPAHGAGARSQATFETHDP